ncbi:unnamed protein product [Lymnaea stagnalis]|uniref:Nucleolar GTP-binding protein 2 n=1 Tax=Lymnaea stagnalis TaxID=6523 RepID=A0AAV2HH15_LYMST
MGKPRQTLNKANHSMNPDRPKTSAGMRDRSTINRIQMYRNFKPKRDRSGRIIKAAPFQSTLKSGSMARVEPNRKWFGNTRVVTQNALQAFNEAMNKVKADPYKVVMNPTKNPVTLLSYTPKAATAPRLLDREPFEQVFGKKATRKRPTLSTYDLGEMVKNAEDDLTKWEESQSLVVTHEDGVKDGQLEIVFKAGTSKRIWNELYKVIDSSDVLVQVLDARDPNGTRCRQVESYLKREKPHKHLVFVLNKADLVPNWAIKKWVAILSAEHPTMAFRASITNCFGKGDLISLLRQFTKLHKDKKQVSVGLIGYPNVGKSSIINALKSKKVCNVAPVPGETKVWQYVTLMNNLFLIDCPGIVYPTGATPTDLVLKGVVRVEKVNQPEDYIHAVLERVKKEYVQKTYGITDWETPEDFLEQVAKKSGRLLKGGEADLSTVAKNILNDYQRGKIPYFVRPPESELVEDEEQEDDTVNEEIDKAKTDEKDADKDIETEKENVIEHESISVDDELITPELEEEVESDDGSSQKMDIKESKSIKSKDQKKEKKGLASIHPFFQRASRKLGDIKKKMAKLKQNLKDIQSKKKERESKKSNPETELDSSAQNKLAADEVNIVASSKNVIGQLPQYMKLPTDDIFSSELPRSKSLSSKPTPNKKSTPNKSSVTQSPSPVKSSRKRKIDDETTPTPTAKKGRPSIVSTPRGAVAVSNLDTSSSSAPGSGKRTTDSATPSTKKSTPQATSSSKRRKNKRLREEDEEETPQPKGLEKRRIQRQEIREMNKKTDFYKEKDVKNRRQSRRQ